MRVYAVYGSVIEEGAGRVPCVINVGALGKRDARMIAQESMIERGIQGSDLSGKVDCLGTGHGWEYGQTLWIH